MGVTVKEEIPICHMLTVAAACLEREHANPKLSEDLRAAAKEEARVHYRLARAFHKT
jgi:hypothetical protein